MAKIMFLLIQICRSYGMAKIMLFADSNLPVIIAWRL